MDKAKNRVSGKDQAVLVSWTWERTQQVRRSGLASYSEGLGTVKLDQVGCYGAVRELYERNWHILKPSTFERKEKELASKTIKRKVVILIPAVVVGHYLRQKKPKTKDQAIKQAIKSLAKYQQPITYHTVNGLLALRKMESSRWVITAKLKAMDYEREFSIGKVPYWSPKRVAA